MCCMHAYNFNLQSKLSQHEKVEWEMTYSDNREKERKKFPANADQLSVFIQRSGIKRFLSLRDFIYIVIYIKVMWYVDIVMF